MELKLTSALDMHNDSSLKISLAVGPASTARFPKIENMTPEKAQAYLNSYNPQTGKIQFGRVSRTPAPDYIAQLRQKAAPPAVDPAQTATEYMDPKMNPVPAPAPVPAADPQEQAIERNLLTAPALTPEQEEEQAIEKGTLNAPAPQTPEGRIDQNTPLPRLQEYRQQLLDMQQAHTGKLQQISEQLPKVDTYIQRAQTPGAPAPAANVPAPATPAQTPITGTPAPGGAAGQMGNMLGRGLKAPGRAIGKGVDWLKQKGQQFGQGFSAAEGEGPILTASMGSSQSLFD